MSDIGDIFAKAFTLGYETGRNYIPAGGMALTAEQVEDVRTALNAIASFRKTGKDAAASAHRLRALFLATEPAEHVHVSSTSYTKVGAWTVSTCRTCGVAIERATADGAWIESEDDPAPTEPTGDVGHGSVDDGMGSEWPRCKADCGIEVVRPGKAQCDCTEPTGEDDPDDISGFMDALKASRAHNPTPAEPIEELEPDEEPEWVQRLAEKWTSAMTAARKSEHHYPADCLAEAVDMLLGGHLAAPAEPVKEATKAQPWIVQLPEGMTMEQWIESLPDEAPGLLAAVHEVRERLGISSPVAPAPTETGAS